jgi:hypothetical protein
VGSVSLASPIGGYICSVSLFNAHSQRDEANDLTLGIPKHILSAEEVVLRNIWSMGSGFNTFDEYEWERAITPPRQQTSVDVLLQVFPKDGARMSTLVKKGRPLRTLWKRFGLQELEEMQPYFTPNAKPLWTFSPHAVLYRSRA